MHIDRGAELSLKIVREFGETMIVPLGVPDEQRVTIVEQFPGQLETRCLLTLPSTSVARDQHVRLGVLEQFFDRLPPRQIDEIGCGAGQRERQTQEVFIEEFGARKIIQQSFEHHLIRTFHCC